MALVPCIGLERAAFQNARPPPRLRILTQIQLRFLTPVGNHKNIHSFQLKTKTESIKKILQDHTKLQLRLHLLHAEQAFWEGYLDPLSTS